MYEIHFTDNTGIKTEKKCDARMNVVIQCKYNGRILERVTKDGQDVTESFDDLPIH